ncbi:MAG: hypothetical protein J3R72DRAFT_460154 [Linnemannia gamsii]|nr:MAG: hypothetical protein J3R72DRAFT_460154 [Linnemannia gamsii]
MLETAGQSMTSPSESNAPASFRPTVSTTNGNAPGNSGDNVLSPIRSPGQQQYSNNPYQLGEDEDSTDDEDNMHDDDPYGAYGDMPPPPQAPFKQQQPGVEESPRLNAVVSPTSDDDFFGDVLAAVEKTAVPPPPTSSSSSHSQFNPDSYTKPQLPPMPADNNPAPAPPPAQYTVQQQIIPAAQPQHLTQEVFGAPSPRMKPAALPTTTAQYQQQHGYPAPPPPAPPARAKGHSPVMHHQNQNQNQARQQGPMDDDPYY